MLCAPSFACRAVFGEGGKDMSGMGTTSDDNKGVIIVGANCLIRMINEPAAKLFGYLNRAELLGKNVNVLIPPPFSRQHNNYIRNYVATGVCAWAQLRAVWSLILILIRNFNQNAPDLLNYSSQFVMLLL